MDIVSKGAGKCEVTHLIQETHYPSYLSCIIHLNKIIYEMLVSELASLGEFELSST